MKNKPIIIIAGDIKSIFFEIFFKSLKKIKLKSPIILISSKNIINIQSKKFNFRKRIKFINIKNLDNYKLNNKTINVIDIKFKKEKKKYIEDCFQVAFKLLKNKYSYKFINGPINKYNFLNKKYLGITEYIAKKFERKKIAMLIHNKELSVCPITTHLPLKLVTRKINMRLIKEKVILINQFYQVNYNFIPRIAVLGLNPHCESIHKFNEDKKIVLPAIKKLKSIGYKISGPYPSDTIFLKQNRKKFDVILGMYHDQVLTPIKTLFEYDAINITLGLPFYRISPDHGPNEKMVGKNLSNPTSLVSALKFLDKR